jgi:hypothetical protein
MPTLFAQSVFARLSVARTQLALTAALSVCCASAAQAAGPTGLLNDTGQTQCDNGSNVMAACTLGNTGDAAAVTYKRQDGRFGRDPAAPAKVGAGVAGFDFTPLDASGVAIALTGTPAVPSATPRCIKDNVTNLIWEVKTTSGLQNTTNTYTWYNSNNATNGGNAGVANGGSCSGGSGCDTEKYVADINALNLCGFGTTGWRLPTRRELLSIALNDGSNPSIDASYFPGTQSNWYWTSDTYAPGPSGAWIVIFGGGNSSAGSKTFTYYVRLVRSGQ